MKNIIIITLIAFCACNEIQMPKNASIEPFKSKVFDKFFDTDESYPKEWRMNAIEGDRSAYSRRYYKLAFLDIDKKLHITKHCYQCAKRGGNVRVYIQHNKDFNNLFLEIFNSTHTKDKHINSPLYAVDFNNGCDQEFMVEYDTYLIDANYMDFNGSKMILVTPEMEKEGFTIT